MKTINHECYVSLEVAKLLKEAGFDWECRKRYTPDGLLLDYPVSDEDFLEFDEVFAPSLDVAQRWLREVKYLDIIVNRNFPIHELQYSWEYEYVIIASDGRVEAADCYFEEYEQAQEAGEKKALEIILEKGE